VVVGQHVVEHVTGNNYSAASLLFGIGSERRTSEAHDVKEWQIRYRAKDAPALTPAVAVVPAAAAPLPEAAGTLPQQPVPVAPQ
jgi:hypothetical protein